MPLLTVGMPVYNAMPYLPQAVESILRQTYSDFYFIIVNDGSSDDSRNYLDSIRDERVRVIHQKNQGLGSSLNRIIAECKTEFFARMDADDVSYPERLELQIDRLKRFPEVVMLSTQVEFICGHKTFSGTSTPTQHEAIHQLLLKGKAAICHPACVFRLKALKDIGGYRVKQAGEDSDVFLRMCEIGTVANLGQVLHRMRIHRNSICFGAWDEVNKWRVFSIYCAKYRLANKMEPSVESFFKKWEKRGILRKTLDYLDAWSALEYRNAMMDIADSKRVRGLFRMIVAAIFRPEAVFRRIMGRICRAKYR